MAVENLVNVQKAHRQKWFGEFLTSCKTWQLAILWTLCKTTWKVMNVDTTTQVADFMENNVNFHIAIHVYSVNNYWYICMAYKYSMINAITANIN